MYTNEGDYSDGLLSMYVHRVISRPITFIAFVL